MANFIQSVDSFHTTRRGKLIFGAAEILLAYGIVSRAVYTGSLLEYGLSLLLMVGGINNLARAVFNIKKTNVKAKTKKA